MFHKVLKGIAGIVQFGCIGHCFSKYVVDFVYTTGPSMEPAVKQSDIFLIEHRSVRKQTIRKNDIVISKCPNDPHVYVCKRVTGLEGDIMTHPKPEGHTYKYIPKGHVWLEGDNKENSTDSRNYGPVPYGLLRGRIFYKVWPLEELGFDAIMQWPPSYRIYDYNGPYPLFQLESARRNLIGNLQFSPNNSMLEYLKPVLGIDTSFRAGQRPSPVLIPELRGQNVDVEALPGSAFTRSFDSSYFTAGPRTRVSDRWRRYVRPPRPNDAVQNGSIYGSSRAILPDRPGILGPAPPLFNNQTRPSASISSPDQLPSESSAKYQDDFIARKGSPSHQSSRGLENLKRKHGGNPSAEVGESKKNRREETPGQVDFPLDKQNDSVLSSERVSNRWSANDITIYTDTYSEDQLEGLFLIYKCDFCSRTFGQNKEQLKQHLYDADHFSGSLYSARNIGRKLELVSVCCMRAVENADRARAAFIVACPKCDFTSNCVFTVSLHHMYQHGPDAMYCLVAVTDNKVVHQSSESECLACGAKYSKKAKLNKHWEDYPTHAPENGLRGQNKQYVAYCPFCDYSMLGNIRDVRSHAVNEHPFSLGNRRMIIPVRITALPKEKAVLPKIHPPLKNNKSEFESLSLHKERDVLTTLLIVHSKNMHIKQRLVELNRLLD